MDSARNYDQNDSDETHVEAVSVVAVSSPETSSIELHSVRREEAAFGRIVPALVALLELDVALLLLKRLNFRIKRAEIALEISGLIKDVRRGEKKCRPTPHLLE